MVLSACTAHAAEYVATEGFRLSLQLSLHFAPAVLARKC